MYAIDDLLADAERRQLLAASIASAAAPVGVRDAKIKITSRCNLRCSMCHYGTRADEHALPTAKWLSTLGQLREMGCAKVHFSGGEPFVRSDFLDVVERATSLGLKTNLTTNGTLLTKEHARRLVRARASGVSISLDGPTARLHDAIRGHAGAFKRTLRSIDWLRTVRPAHKTKPEIRINVVLMRENYRRLPDMVRLAGEIGADDVIVMPVDETDKGRRRLSGSQIDRFNADIAPRVLELRNHYGFDARPERVFVFGTTQRDVKYAKRGLYARGLYERLPCFAPWLHVFVAWDGQLYPCCMTTELTEPFGNLDGAELAQIWTGERYRGLRQRFLAGDPLPTCHRCDLFLAENRRLAEALDIAPRETSAAGPPPRSAVAT